jgi:GNAT superfamily N-acetyltransferase
VTDDALQIEPVDPAAADGPAGDLLAALGDYYRELYGGIDALNAVAGDFRPPSGRFLVGSRGAEPLVVGGWRRVPGDAAAAGAAGDGAAAARTVEITQMYVRPTARRQGLGRRMLTALERDAADAGATRVVLIVGGAQPEALAMYAGAGYRPVEPYTEVSGFSDPRFFGRRLPT